MMSVGFLFLGIVAGVLSGLFGIGGGIVMVPSLIFFFGLDILDANATSLGAMLLPVGILGVVAYHKAGLLRWVESGWIALGLLAGSFVGGELAVHLNEGLLSKFYAVILLYIALTYLDVFSRMKRKKPAEAVSLAEVHRPVWGLLLVGLAAGIFAGLFGKGGGIVIVPLLVGLFRYDYKAAVATSLAALQLPVGLPSVLIYAQNGHLNLAHAGWIALGILLGSLAGSKLGLKLPVPMFKKVFAVFLLVVAVYMAFKYR
jgi:uncharacterized membrane protein YfcA